MSINSFLDHEKFTEAEVRRTKEISVLNKQLDEESKRARHLEVQNQMTRKKLDRKTEELATVIKKARDSNLANPVNRTRRTSLASISRNSSHDHLDEAATHINDSNESISISNHQVFLSLILECKG